MPPAAMGSARRRPGNSVGLHGPIRSTGFGDAARRWWPYPPLPSRTRACGAGPVGLRQPRDSGRLRLMIAQRPPQAGELGCERATVATLACALASRPRSQAASRSSRPRHPLRASRMPIDAAIVPQARRACRQGQSAQIAVAVPARRPRAWSLPPPVLCSCAGIDAPSQRRGPPGCGRCGIRPRCCRPPPPAPWPASARRRGSPSGAGWSHPAAPGPGSARPRLRSAARRRAIAPAGTRSARTAWRRTPGVWSSSKAGSAFSSVRRPRPTGNPRSSKKPRIWLISAVRIPTSRSRARCSACTSSCAGVLIGTNRICGRCTASQIASASVRSFLCVLTNGLTYWPGISRTA